MNTNFLSKLFSCALVACFSTAVINATPLSFEGKLTYDAKDLTISEAGIENIQPIFVNFDYDVANDVSVIVRGVIGDQNASVRQLYVSFDNFAESLLGDIVNVPNFMNFQTAIGQKSIRFGREGHLRSTQTLFIDKTDVTNAVLFDVNNNPIGNPAIGQGVEVNTEINTVFPLSLNIAAFEDTTTRVESDRPLIAAQVNTSYAVGLSDIELGLDLLYGADSKDAAYGFNVGLDYNSFFGFADVSMLSINDSTDTYYALTLGYNLASTYDLAARYASSDLENATDLISILASKKISNDLKLQLQYNIVENSDNNLKAQFVFHLN